MVAMNPEAELLDVKQVATMLSCSSCHVYRLAERGALPGRIKLGNLVRWPRAEIAAWIAGGCRPIRTLRANA